MTGGLEAEDFASAAMMRLVAAGLTRQGITPAFASPSGARIPRMAKRAALNAILSEHGAISILRIADALPSMAAEPLTVALTQARDMEDLLQRWRRMERFSHTRHKIIVEVAEADSARFRHVSRVEATAPSQDETLLVAAVLAGLAEHVIGAPVDLRSASGDILRQAGDWRAPVNLEPGELLILSGQSAPLSNCAPAPRDVQDFVEELRGVLASDLVRRWTLSELAALAGTSTRTLQRRLSENAASFSRLLAGVRLQRAAEYLCDKRGPGLAEIGFLSGYADQSHFTRTFRAAVGVPPSAYREEFAR